MFAAERAGYIEKPVMQLIRPRGKTTERNVFRCGGASAQPARPRERLTCFWLVDASMLPSAIAATSDRRGSRAARCPATTSGGSCERRLLRRFRPPTSSEALPILGWFQACLRRCYEAAAEGNGVLAQTDWSHCRAFHHHICTVVQNLINGIAARGPGEALDISNIAQARLASALLR